MKVPDGLVPQKVVAHDLCVSIVTLWRARNSKLPDFPEPVIFKNLVFWRRDDLERLEAALLKFRGRCEFEKLQKVVRASKALKRAHQPNQRRCLPIEDAQADLFK